MLYVGIHRHAGADCPVDAPAPVEKVALDDHAAECGVKVLGRYISPPEHQLFFILEADDYDNIVKFFRPLMKIGTHRIHPVTHLGRAIEILTK